MIYKESMFPAIGPDGQPTVRLLSNTASELGLEKVAGVHPEILSYKEQLEPDPNKTYVHILALGAGDYYGANLNNDHFPWSGLSHDHTKTPHPYMHGHKTFLNAHAFAHHVNKDPEKAYGDVLVSVLNQKMKRVELIVAIDNEKCERNGGGRTLQRINNGEFPSTSMGCRVPFDVCSICGHKAKYRSEYCSHMRDMPGKILPDGRKVFVYNPYPRFFDISFVFIGADRTSFVLEKVASVGTAASMIGGAALGGGIQAFSGSDHDRLKRVAAGAFGGSLAGALGHGFKANASTRMMLAGGAGYMGGQLARNVNPPVPVPPATSDRLQKAASAQLGRLLREKSGTKRRQKKRLKRKVARMRTNKIRPLTFSKLNTSARRAQQQMQLNMSSNVPQITFNYGPLTYSGPIKNVKKEVEDMAEGKSKTAEVSKLSEIFKDVNAHPMGKAVPMMVSSEPDLPRPILDRITRSHNLGETLSGAASMGIVLKPREFQHVILRRTGQNDLAEALDRSGEVFPQKAPVVKSMRIKIRAPEGGVPAGLFDMLRSALSHRSSLSPFAIRRDPAPIRVRAVRINRSPVMLKLASMYNGYREDVLLQTESMVKAAMLTPSLMNDIEITRGGRFLEGPDGNSLSMMPLAYFSAAYWNRCCCDRSMSDEEFAKQFAEDNPEISKYLAQYVAQSNDLG